MADVSQAPPPTDGPPTTDGPPEGAPEIHDVPDWFFPGSGRPIDPEAGYFGPVLKDPPAEVTSLMLALVILGIAVVIHLENTLKVFKRLRKERKNMWSFIVFIGLLIWAAIGLNIALFIQYITYSMAKMLPLILQIPPQIIELSIGMILTVLKAFRVKMAHPFDPTIFWVLFFTLVLPAVTMAFASATWQVLVIADVIPWSMSASPDYKWLMGYYWVSAMICVSVICDALFLSAVLKAIVSTSKRGHYPRLSFENALIIFAHVGASSSYIYLTFSPIPLTGVLMSFAFQEPVLDFWVFLVMNEQVAAWFAQKRQAKVSTLTTPRGFCQSEATTVSISTPWTPRAPRTPFQFSPTGTPNTPYTPDTSAGASTTLIASKPKVPHEKPIPSARPKIKKQTDTFLLDIDLPPALPELPHQTPMDPGYDWKANPAIAAGW